MGKKHLIRSNGVIISKMFWLFLLVASSAVWGGLANHTDQEPFSKAILTPVPFSKAIQSRRFLPALAPLVPLLIEGVKQILKQIALLMVEKLWNIFKARFAKMKEGKITKTYKTVTNIVSKKVAKSSINTLARNTRTQTIMEGTTKITRKVTRRVMSKVDSSLKEKTKAVAKDTIQEVLQNNPEDAEDVEYEYHDDIEYSDHRAYTVWEKILIFLGIIG